MSRIARDARSAEWAKWFDVAIIIPAVLRTEALTATGLVMSSTESG